MILPFNQTLLVFIGMFLFASCELAEVPLASESESVFNTSAPSRLYFKNIRSASYQKMMSPERGTDIYYLRTMNLKTKEPALIPQIVDHWLDDKAYLRIRKNDDLLFSDTLTLQWSMADSIGFLHLHNAGNIEQYNFAANLHQLLKINADINVKTRDGTFVPVMHTAINRSAFITTLRDYYRLTDLNTGSLF